jgi:hypothetical protein
MNQPTALQYCENLSLDGYSDWRLPTISELKTLIVGCQSGTDVCKVSDKCLSSDCWSKKPCLCKDKHGAGEGGYYWQKGVWQDGGNWFWSSSLLSGNANGAWMVIFLNGYVNNYHAIYNDRGVRCVRGQMKGQQ